MSQEIATKQEETIEAVSATALEHITRGEIDIQIATAKRYPRDVQKAVKRAIDLATFDEETAESCWYSLTRGKGTKDEKIIEGPSIRLAEIFASTWGNLRVGSMITEIGERMLTSRGMVHDLESNVAYFADVQRRITGKFGRFNDDMIITTANAASSIAIRNAIIKVIPRTFVDKALAAAKAKAMGGSVPLEARRQKAIDFFNKCGVSTEKLLSALDLADVSDIGLPQMEILIGLHNRLKEGAPIDEVFPAPPTTGVNSLNAAIKNGNPTPAANGSAPTNEGIIQTFLTLNIGVEKLEAKIGAPVSKWTEEDRARLASIATNIVDGSHAPDDYFGS